MTDTPALTIGQRFGFLRVVSFDKYGRRIGCVCVCRKLCVVSGDDLLQGLRNSCGCQAPTLANRQAFRAAQAENLRRRDLAWNKMERKS